MKLTSLFPLTLLFMLAGCCNTLGVRWLDSCRTPSLHEMDVVAQCLEAGHKANTQAYGECLESKGVDYSSDRDWKKRYQ